MTPRAGSSHMELPYRGLPRIGLKERGKLASTLASKDKGPSWFPHSSLAFLLYFFLACLGSVWDEPTFQVLPSDLTSSPRLSHRSKITHNNRYIHAYILMVASRKKIILLPHYLLLQSII